MSKRRDATRGGIEHGVVSHATHQRDKLAFSGRRNARKSKAFVAVDIADLQSDYPPFESDVSAIGNGANWLVGRRSGAAYLSECNGDRWIDLMSRIRSWANHYHQRQVRYDPKTEERRVGYYRRKVKDRVKLGPTDRHARKETDLMRETIDLRPDHSRALEYMLGNRKLRSSVGHALEDIRQEKIRLFEEIYGRRVVGVGEHPDSGQYHNDLWHTGIQSVVVEDYGAVAPEYAGDEELEGGEPKRIRLRNVFRQYGVSIGLVSWYRHRQAAEELRVDTGKMMGEERKLIASNWKSAREQNGEHPRDLRLIRKLDKFVKTRLEKIEPDLCRRANEEYVHWLKVGYGQGKLGLMGRSQRVEKLEMEVVELRAEARTNAGVRSELKTMISDLEKEAEELRGELSAEKNAKEKIAEELENTKAERDGFQGQVDELTQQLSKEQSVAKKLEEQLEADSSVFEKLREKSEAGYYEVCEERDEAISEKNAVSSDLEKLRAEHATTQAQLTERDSVIENLRKEVSGLQSAFETLKSNYDKLVDLVKGFAVKLLGKREIMNERRYGGPFFEAFDAMFLEVCGKSVDEHNREFEAPPKSTPSKGQPGKGTERGPSKSEGH